MEFTGERFVPGVQGSIELEHLHRYLQACELAPGKVVLDIACGEGYGSNMIAGYAEKVFGVDISEEAVKHARDKYRVPNLEFMVGNCAAIPLADHSVDLVVSFETIEHHDQHDEMMAEIRRVLKVDGLLLISSPDKLHYSIEPNNVNPHHVKELFEAEFRGLLSKSFSNVNYFAQRIIYGSGIFGVGIASNPTTYHLRNQVAEKTQGLDKPMYWIALASNANLPPLNSGVLEQPIEDSEMTAFWRELMGKKDEALGSSSQAQQQLDAALKDAGSTIVELQREIETFSELQKNSIQQITELTESDNSLRAQIKILTHSIDAHEQYTADLERSRNECAEEADRLRLQLDERQASVEQIQRKMAEQIRWINAAFGEFDTLPANDSSLTEQDHILEFQKRLALKHAHSANGNDLTEKERQQISVLTDSIQLNLLQIEELRAKSRQQGVEIAGLKAKHGEEINARHSHIHVLEVAVGDRDIEIARLNANIQKLHGDILAVRNSRSYRATMPFRRVTTLLREVRRNAPSAALRIYRAMPLQPRNKQKIKNFAFGTFGFALKKWSIYQQWKSYQEIASTWNNDALSSGLATESTANASSTNASGQIVTQRLLNADGKWEWADYAPVKTRIEQVQKTRLHAVAPTPLQVVSIFDDECERSVTQILLRPCGESPDVSIIIPVFNNIRLTLECLISISNAQEERISIQVIVADDASTDETVRYLKAVPNLVLVQNERNLGFLRNCNSALGQVQGKYLVYLNNDTQVTDGWLGALLRTFKLYPNTGAVGPKFVYPNGYLQEAGVALMPDGSAEMIGLNDDPSAPRFTYTRRVDYVSGACLMLPTDLVRKIGGFSEEFLPCYCEDSDLCLAVQDAGFEVYFNPNATVIHHLSKTTAETDNTFKMECINRNLLTLQEKWQTRIQRSMDPKLIAFFLPQFHPMPENDEWWGKGFTEWTNVTKAQPNFTGHYQPRMPADLGYYDLRLNDVLTQQAELATRYGVEGFCFYYYWFGGKRLLERPIEQMLALGTPDFPFCLCWANENWTRRWDGNDHEVLMAQAHSEEDDAAIIQDLMRYFRDARYIRVDGKPLLLIYRVTLFPDFAATAQRWRALCRQEGIGEIYIAMVESFDLVHATRHPSEFGCDAAVEFPPQGLAQQKDPSGEIVNPDFQGSVADYRDLAVSYSTRPAPAYTRFRSVTPGWDNTARRQNNSFCFEHATPGAFQAWLENALHQTRVEQFGDERLVFVNAWNEWAEGAYLEPDRRFGHTFLEAVRNAYDASRLTKAGDRP